MQYPPGLSTAPLFDLDFAVRRHGDMEIVRLLVPIGVESLQQARGLLDDTVTVAPARAQVLHKLRGSAMELGLERLVRATRDYESVCRVGSNEPQIADAHRQFMPVLMDTLRALQAGGMPSGQPTS